MAFDRPAGPPATARQLRQLEELIIEAGHSDFRDARGPLGFTQRQANGKFTSAEATAYIERLENDAFVEGRVTPPRPAPRLTRMERTARELPTEVLAAELQRRGWVALEP